MSTNVELIDGGNFNHEQCASIAILEKIMDDTYMNFVSSSGDRA